VIERVVDWAMTNQVRHITSQESLSRRQALALIGAAGLAASAPRHGFAVSFDFARFNRRYVETVVVPRFRALASACTKWSAAIAPMVQKPSAAKASMMQGGDEAIWEAWMAAEPFMTLGRASQSRDESPRTWVEQPDELSEEVAAVLARNDADDLASSRIGKTSLGRHSLTVMDLLLNGEGERANIIHDFYLADSGARRTAVLHAVVSHMAAKADASAAAWTEISQNGLLSGATAQETASRFLSDQVDLLKDVVFTKMKVEPRPEIDLVRPSGIERRLGDRIMANLQAANDAVRSPAGFGSLLSGSDTALHAKLRDTCAIMLNLSHQSMALGYPSPRYTGFFFTTMCCFSPCPPQEELDRKAEARNEENRLKVEALRVEINSLRHLLQADLAKAVGLSAELKKL
jgi:predicted lipoprotein